MDSPPPPPPFQLVEHRTGNVEVTGSNPAESLILFLKASIILVIFVVCIPMKSKYIHAY